MAKIYDELKAASREIRRQNPDMTTAQVLRKAEENFPEGTPQPTIRAADYWFEDLGNPRRTKSEVPIGATVRSVKRKYSTGDIFNAIHGILNDLLGDWREIYESNGIVLPTTYQPSGLSTAWESAIKADILSSDKELERRAIECYVVLSGHRSHDFETHMRDAFRRLYLHASSYAELQMSKFNLTAMIGVFYVIDIPDEWDDPENFDRAFWSSMDEE